jgi:methylmalonyl-CoA epimerase
MTDPGGSSVRLAHLGVVVHQLDAAERVYGRIGLSAGRRTTLDSEGVRVAFIKVNDAEIELLQPLTSGGPLGRFLSARGEGIHHVALEVTDIEGALARARAAGMHLIDEAPRPGAHGTRVAFLHPRSAHGVLVELIEQPAGASSVDLP